MCSWWWGSVAEDVAALLLGAPPLLWLLLGAPLLLWLSARLWHLYILARYSDPHFTTDRPLPNGSMGLPWLGETLEFLYKSYLVPKGWAVIYSIRETHEYGGDAADAFTPERWLGNKTASSISFGSGIRSCIGKEFAKLLIKIFTIEVCRDYYCVLPQGLSDLKLIPVPTPKDGQPARITKRLL